MYSEFDYDCSWTEYRDVTAYNISGGDRAFYFWFRERSRRVLPVNLDMFDGLARAPGTQ